MATNLQLVFFGDGASGHSTGSPSYAGFVDFVRNQMGINATVLPDDSSSLPLAYAMSIEIVNKALNAASNLMYSQAVYNLAGDILINIAQDQEGQTYFKDLRDAWNIFSFVAGVIESSDDQGTGQSLLVPEAMKGLTFSDLQNLKTPYGRAYLAIAQRYGTMWGIN